MILQKIEQLLQEVQQLQASSAEEIEALRVKYLSKKGEITALMADFRQVPAEKKKAVGMLPAATVPYRTSPVQPIP